MPTKLEKLKDLVKLVNESLTREEFLIAFENLLLALKQMEVLLSQRIDSKTTGAKEELDKLKDAYKDAIQRIEADNVSTLSNLKRWALERVGELFIKNRINEQLREKFDEVDQRLEGIRDGAIGPMGPPGAPGSPGSPDTAQDIANKLETLDGDERLDRTAIRGITVSPQAPDNPKEGDLWIET